MSHILELIISAPNSFCIPQSDTLKEEGLSRSWILKFLGFNTQSSLNSSQQFEVVLAIFYHLVDDLFAKGCSMSEICTLAKLTAEYWCDSIDRSLQENIQCLHRVVDPLVPCHVTERSAEIYLKYMVQSFLQHFNLYRACLAVQGRDPRLRRGVTVEAADAPMALHEGRRPDEHQYHCQLREIETEEQLARGGRIAKRLDDTAELMQRQRDVEDRIESEETGDEYPNTFIGDCIELNMRQMRIKVQDLAENSSIDLIYKAKRTALPRPTSMGPPPRFTAGGPSVVGAAADRKSATSSRSSAKSRTADGAKKAPAAAAAAKAKWDTTE